MKHLKLFEEIKDIDQYYFGENKPDPIDPFGEEDWDEVEPDGTFLTWLKREYPDKNSWKKIKEIDCSNNNLTSLEGIENLRNLTHLWYYNNNFSNDYKNYLKKYCKENKIILR